MEITQSAINEGLGLHSTKSHQKGDIIFTLTGKIYTEPIRETIYIGNGEHIYDEHGIFMNHSFTPTTRIDGCKCVCIARYSPRNRIIIRL